LNEEKEKSAQFHKKRRPASGKKKTGGKTKKKRERNGKNSSLLGDQKTGGGAGGGGPRGGEKRKGKQEACNRLPDKSHGGGENLRRERPRFRREAVLCGEASKSKKVSYRRNRGKVITPNPTEGINFHQENIYC